MNITNTIRKAIDRLRYEAYKRRVIEIGAQAHPLAAYPFLAFVEFNLDAAFEKGGLQGAVNAVEAYLKDPVRPMTMAEVIEEERQKSLERFGEPNGWVIYSKPETDANEEPMFWSNEDGWGDLKSATRFETFPPSLPIGATSVMEVSAAIHVVVQYDHQIPE